MIGIGSNAFAAALGRSPGGPIAPPPALPEWASVTIEEVEALYHDETTRGVQAAPRRRLGEDDLLPGMSLSGGVLRISGTVDLGGRDDRGGWDFGATPVAIAAGANVTGLVNCRIRLAEGDVRPALRIEAGVEPARIDRIAWCEIVGGFEGAAVLCDVSGLPAGEPLPRIGVVERNFLGGIGTVGYRVPSSAVVRWNYVDAPGNLSSPPVPWDAGTAYGAGAAALDGQGRTYVSAVSGNTAPLPGGVSDGAWTYLDETLANLHIGGAEAATEVYGNFLNRDPVTRILGAHRGAGGPLVGLTAEREAAGPLRHVAYARNLVTGPEGGGAVPLRLGGADGRSGWEPEHVIQNWITPGRDGRLVEADVQSGILAGGQQVIGTLAYDRERIVAYVVPADLWDISDGAINDWPAVPAPSFDTGYAVFGG